MSLEYRFTFPLPNGLHARPASQLAAKAELFANSTITLTNQRTGAQAEVASVLGLVSAGVRCGDACVLTVSGADAESALDALRDYIERVLPTSDEPLPAPVAVAVIRLPRGLIEYGKQGFTGTPASFGVGIGELVRLDKVAYNSAVEPDPITSDEPGRLEHALAAVDAELARAAETSGSEVLQATLAILRDKALRFELLTALGETGRASAAVVGAVAHFTDRLQATGSEYLLERIVDLEDIQVQLLEELGIKSNQLVELTEPSIVVAQSLAARQFFALDRTMLRGLVLTEAGTTSHAVILARSYGIPVLAGISFTGTDGGRHAVLDGTRGLLWPAASAGVLRFYEREQQRDNQRRTRQQEAGAQLATTRDGRRLEIGANISSAVEARTAVELGAEGVGLFRTELLFASRDSAPTEEEQYAEYSTAVEALAGRPLIIRTLDIGGDKPLPFLPLPREDNPFLGWRGVRLYAEHSPLITAQLRAIIRASAFGPVKVMAPMVSTPCEARRFRESIKAVHAELASEGVAFDPMMPIGVMIETPAAALCVAALAPYCDFFSLGTNDLCQYFMAADRGNPQVSGLNDPRHPGFLCLLRSCVDDARRFQRWIGMCGEMAGQLDLLPLVLGLGMDEISVSAPGIPALKRAIAQRSYTKCGALLDVAATCGTAEEVQSLLAIPPRGATQPLTTTELVVLQSDATSKLEVLKDLADLAYAAGRTDDVDALEEALWAREETFSTGLGYGFAIPHCKTMFINAPTLAVLRLVTPVDWGACDDAPVDSIIMLAVPEADGAQLHLRIFARLARRLMHEDFREALRALTDARAVVNYLATELELSTIGEE